jgi:hypothetical protein
MKTDKQFARRQRVDCHIVTERRRGSRLWCCKSRRRRASDAGPRRDAAAIAVRRLAGPASDRLAGRGAGRAHYCAGCVNRRCRERAGRLEWGADQGAGGVERSGDRGVHRDACGSIAASNADRGRLFRRALSNPDVRNSSALMKKNGGGGREDSTCFKATGSVYAGPSARTVASLSS